MTEISPGVTRLGNQYVNWFMIEQGGRFTVIDGGLPTQLALLEGALQTRGLSMDSVDAVVLTHGHGDHVGSTAGIVEASGAAVHLHAADHRTAAGEGEGPSNLQLLPWLLRPTSARFLISLLRGGISKVPPLLQASDMADGEVLDVPGRLQVAHVPGHTAGSCVLRSADVIFTGDALLNADFLRGTVGPSISPSLFNHDSDQALASLNRIEGMGTAMMAPGHGEPWRGDIGEAVAAARRVGVR